MDPLLAQLIRNVERTGRTKVQLIQEIMLGLDRDEIMALNQFERFCHSVGKMDIYKIGNKLIKQVLVSLRYKKWQFHPMYDILKEEGLRRGMTFGDMRIKMPNLNSLIRELYHVQRTR